MGFPRHARRLVTFLPQVALTIVAGTAVAMLERRRRRTSKQRSAGGGGDRLSRASSAADCCCDVLDPSDSILFDGKGSKAGSAAGAGGSGATWLGFAASVLQQLGLPAPPAGLTTKDLIEKLRNAWMVAVSAHWARTLIWRV